MVSGVLWEGRELQVVLRQSTKTTDPAFGLALTFWDIQGTPSNDVVNHILPTCPLMDVTLLECRLFMHSHLELFSFVQNVFIACQVE